MQNDSVDPEISTVSVVLGYEKRGPRDVGEIRTALQAEALIRQAARLQSINYIFNFC